MSLTFRRADAADVDAIVALVNSAYRGESSRVGWTTEADYLEGKRTDENEVRSELADPNAAILLCERDGAPIGTVLLRYEEPDGYLGMFVVRPDLQNAGIGKAFLDAAEDFVRAEWNPPRIWMSVLSQREELIAFYQRRGYARTGRYLPFPRQTLSTWLVPDLKFEVLEKRLRD